MSPLALHLLGTPRIERDQIAQSIPTRKGIALLAYLAHSQQPISRNELATLFWPELDQQRARAALRRDLHRLNQALGENWASIERESICLHTDVWVDVHAFQQHLDSNELADLETAVSLYRAPYLAGFSLSDSAEFDDWQQRKTNQLQQQLLTTLDKLIAAHEATGNQETAIAHAQHALTIDSLHESAHRHLMRLYHQQGKRQDALRQYQTLTDRLQTELGVAPSAETEAVYAAITTTQTSVIRPPEDSIMKTVDSPSTKRPAWQLWTGIGILLIVV
ncbi:MAG: hypothetical protein GY943_12205, partial [Chloroflexi bacterium]|nr:hypothetical protein [Chloroflexota bacterium]